MTMEVRLNLPPYGLIIRDFILTVLAHICREANAYMTVSSTQVSIYTESKEELAEAYLKILERTHLPPTGLYSRGGKTKEAIMKNKFEEHKEWIRKTPHKIMEVMKSLRNIKWAGPIGNRVIYIGKEPNIAAPLLFKINYYSGKRSFLSSRYRNATIKMDHHSLLFTCVGAALSRTVTTEERITIYVPVLEPGAIELNNILTNTFQEIQGRFSPDVVFKVLIGFKLRTSGMLPLSIIAINESQRQRPTLLSYQELLIEEGISRFVNTLRDRSQEIVVRLLTFTLRNWTTSDKNQRAMIRVGLELAQAIYMASTGAMRPADVMYRLARSTYATTSDEFGRSLVKARYSPIRSLESFRRMIFDVKEALERCFIL